jgi:hypothetical protein
LWLNPLAGRRLDNLITMLVGAGLKPRRLTTQTAKPVVGVGDDSGVGVAQVWLGIYVINGSGDVGGHAEIDLA